MDVPLSLFPTRRVSVDGSVSFTFRTLRRCDKYRAKELHDMCLPVKYNAAFYEAITSPTTKLLTMACLDDNHLVGIIVARIESQIRAKQKGIVDVTLEGNEILYIMTLLVDPQYQRRSIGSMLLSNLIDNTNESIKAVYLHVLDTNSSAMSFYSRNQFNQIKKLFGFYYINGQLCDSYLYVRYLHDGKMPKSSLWNNYLYPVLFCMTQQCPVLEDTPSLLLYLSKLSPTSWLCENDNNNNN